MTCTTPAHAAGAVDVVVTNDFGSDTLVNGFTYNTAPAITAINPANGSTGGGLTVSIAGTGFVSGTTVDFDGTGATGV
ncbi:MAG: cell surface receptor IPT/TIG domain-containing protein, partial [Planctomycetes bacterium]|nr:cell surface receptor IPT/TIG domain-containing protein [Planctomycetota bacterium]